MTEADPRPELAAMLAARLAPAAEALLSRLRGRPGGGPLSRQRKRRAKPGKGPSR